MTDALAPDALSALLSAVPFARTLGLEFVAQGSGDRGITVTMKLPDSREVHNSDLPCPHRS